MKKLLVFLCALTLIFGLAGIANATFIDFRDSSVFGAADNQSTFTTTVGEYDLLFTPEPIPCATLYWDSTDGFGVRHSYEYDEIEYSEYLTINFTDPVFLNSVLVTDLFLNETRNQYTYDEIGWYALDMSSPINSSEFETNMIIFYPSQLTDPYLNPGNGQGTLSINAIVSSITFSAPGKTIPGDHEFSVAGVNVNPIHEPATMLLLGSGLIGLGVLGRKKLFKRG